MSHHPNFVSSGNINPAVFVTISGENTVQQSVAGDIPIGISSPAQKYAPLPGNSDTYAAETGDPIKVFQAGEYCELTAGSGGWTAGQLLKPDANGNGVVAADTSPYGIGARALANANAGELSRVVVEIHNPV
jgi:hypothetical protein